MSELVLNLLNKLSKEEIITLLFSHKNKQKLIKELLEYIGWLKTDQIIVVLDVFSKKQIVESIIFGLTPFGGAELFKKLITKMSKEELISTIASDCSWIKNYGSRLKGLQENVAKDRTRGEPEHAWIVACTFWILGEVILFKTNNMKD